jgi:hypothetical protein
MPVILTKIVKLGSARTGLALRARLINADGSTNGPEVTAGIAEVGNGEYAATLTYPDGFAGFVRFYTNAYPGTFQTAASYNAAEVVPGTGMGARTITFTVTASAVPVQGATVRMTIGQQSYTAVTDVNGQAVFNLDDGTYAWSASKPGYTGSNGTLVVTGNAAQAAALTAFAPPAPPAGLITGTLWVFKGNGQLQASGKVQFRLADTSMPAGESYPDGEWTAISGDGNNGTTLGLLVEYFRPSTDYEGRRGDGAWVPFTAPPTGPFALPSILG